LSFIRVFKNILFTAPLRRKESQPREPKESKLLTFIKKSSVTGFETVRSKEKII
jgi:hypothetical protein